MAQSNVLITNFFRKKFFWRIFDMWEQLKKQPVRYVNKKIQGYHVITIKPIKYELSNDSPDVECSDKTAEEMNQCYHVLRGDD